MRIRHRVGLHTRDLVVDINDPAATIADLEEALDPDQPAGPLWIEGSPPRLVRAATPVDRSGLGDGIVVSRWAPSPSLPTLASLVVTSGLDSARRFDLPAGHYALGRHHAKVLRGDQRDDFEIDDLSRIPLTVEDATVSSRHLAIDVTQVGEIFVRDLGSTNGTWWSDPLEPQDPVPLPGPSSATAWPAGSALRLGACVLSWTAPEPGSTPPGPPPWPRHRTRRCTTSEARSPIEPPGTLADPPVATPVGWVALVATAAVGGAMVLLLHSWTYALFALLGPVVMVANVLDGRRGRRRLRRGTGRRRLDDLRRFDAALAAAGEVERHLRSDRYGGPRDLLASVRPGSQARCWERRPGHADAFAVALGHGDAPWEPPVVGHRPQWADDVTTVVDRHRLLEGAAVGVTLTAGHSLAVVGPTDAARAVCRWLVARVAADHGPADLAVGLVTGCGEAGHWNWLDWLPHSRVAEGSLLAMGDAAGERLAATLFPPDTDRSANPIGERLRLIVIDRPGSSTRRRHPAWTVLRAAEDPGNGVVGLVVLGVGEPIPAVCSTVVHVSADGTLSVDGLTAEGLPIAQGPVAGFGLSLDGACDIALALSAHADPEVAERGGSLGPSVSLMSLLGAERVTKAGVEARWSAGGADPAPVTVIGVADDGPLDIDLVADGPHVLIAGTTGAGKSELLRTLVAGLAIGSSPDHLNFVLIDFKGGSAFDACSRLPHVTGVVTDLDEHLAARALRCLEAELRHREARLRQHGASDLTTWRGLTGVEPMPRLVVVVDEFATLAAALPDFVDSLVDVAQRGRSLGVHLVLATQRPSGVVSERIRANVGLRVALRMRTGDESTDVIGRPDAATISPRTPGRAVIDVGSGPATLIQTATTSAPHLANRSRVTVRPLGVAGALAPEPSDRCSRPTEIGSGAEPPPGPAAGSELEVIVEAVRAAWLSFDRPPIRSPWPEPLPTEVAWPLLHPRSPSPHGAEKAALRSRLEIALADDPDHQCHRPFAWVLGDGPLLAVGLSGKATEDLVATVVLAAAADNPEVPQSTHVHVIDAVGGNLGVLSGLPAVGAVVAAHEHERQRRLIAYLANEMDRRRAAGSGAPATRLVFVLHGLGAFRTRWDDLDPTGTADRLISLVEGGSAVDIHACVTAESPSVVPHRLVVATRQRLVFNLGDPVDAGPLGLAPRDLPPLPQRGAIAVDGPTRIQVATPPEGRAAAVARLAGPTADLGSAPIATGVLPQRIGWSALVTAPHGSASGASGQSDDHGLRLLLGLADDDLEPAEFVLGAGGHGLVAGPPRSGRTTALRTLAWAALSQTPGHPPIDVIVVVPSLDRAADNAPGAHLHCSDPGGPPLRGRPTWADPSSQPLKVFGADDPALADWMTWSGPLLVLVDDADLIDGHHRVLSTLVRQRRPGRHVVAAGRPDRIRARYDHWLAEVRQDLTGLLLRPDVDLDGELIGAQVPRRHPVAPSPGRGWLADATGAGFIQVAVTHP